MTTDRTTPADTPFLRRVHERFLVEERFETAAARRRLYVTSSALALVGLAVFFLVLANVLRGDGLALLDAPVERWANAGRSDFWTGVMVGLSLVFGPLIFPWIALATIVIWGFTARHLWRPLLLAGGTLVGVAGVRGIAELVGRSRPPLVRMMLEPDHSESFPSGHVVGASVFILLIAYLVFSRRKRPRSAVVAFLVAAVLVAATALSRIYLGYHWATDAIASVGLALVVLGAVIAIDTRRTVRVRDGAEPSATASQRGRTSVPGATSPTGTPLG